MQYVGSVSTISLTWRRPQQLKGRQGLNRTELLTRCAHSNRTRVRAHLAVALDVE
jgi:hypothetical protein